LRTVSPGLFVADELVAFPCRVQIIDRRRAQIIPGRPAIQCAQPRRLTLPYPFQQFPGFPCVAEVLIPVDTAEPIE
jgi:hypothetical protein